MGQLRGLRQGPQQSLSGAAKLPRPPRLIILNFLSLSVRTILSFPGAACDGYPQFWPVSSWRSDRLHRPTAAFSLSPTKRTVMGSTSASPPARNAAPTPRVPIASRTISPRLLLIGASIRTKSLARFRNWVRTAIMAGATNTSPLPANVEATAAAGSPATPTPRKRRDAAPRSGYGSRLVPVSDIRAMSRHPDRTSARVPYRL
jgi:hypothetical protein